MSFADRLNSEIIRKDSRLVVGLDPHLNMLPPPLLAGINMTDREALAAVVESFCISIIDAVSDHVPAIKPQVAFFERLGAPGLAVLERVISEIRGRSLIAICDGKRGDIGSTASAYADYHLGAQIQENAPGGLDADAVTLNAYLGHDSIVPYIRHVNNGKGLFLLAKTSNRGSSDLQDKTTLDGDTKYTIYELVAKLASKIDEDTGGSHSYSPIGLVVGATHSKQLAALRASFKRLLFLVPGVGAQGATPEDVSHAFDKDGLGAIVNASRSVIFAYRDAGTPTEWKRACRNAAHDLKLNLNSALRGRRAQ